MLCIFFVSPYLNAFCEYIRVCHVVVVVVVTFADSITI